MGALLIAKEPAHARGPEEETPAGEHVVQPLSSSERARSASRETPSPLAYIIPRNAHAKV